MVKREILEELNRQEDERRIMRQRAIDERRMGIMTMDARFLVSMLQPNQRVRQTIVYNDLPEDAFLVSVHAGGPERFNSIVLVVASPSLEPVPERTMLPELGARITVYQEPVVMPDFTMTVTEGSPV